MLYFAERHAVAPVRDGRVSVDAVWCALADPQRADFYISGPPPMLKAIAADLASRHVAAAAIHIDAWE